jgi:hypothetical protein
MSEAKKKYDYPLFTLMNPVGFGVSSVERDSRSVENNTLKKVQPRTGLKTKGGSLFLPTFDP